MMPFSFEITYSKCPTLGLYFLFVMLLVIVRNIAAKATFDMAGFTLAAFVLPDIVRLSL